MVFKWMGATIGALALASAAPAVAAPGKADGAARDQVAVDAGGLHGATEAGVTSFKGIPYAAPPVGANRWRAPQPVTPWSGVRDATRYGADCAQAPFPPDAAPIATVPAEDCLFLNVWKPAAAAQGARLPVMVWVHGGGFVNGGSSPAVYSGHAFGRDGVVFVSMNYRLGRFGFFAHPGLEQEGFGGNFGFLDQIAALQWVRRNIAAFGGDPDNVTVFGESAGGVSMNMLLQSPLARGLFARAIIESGGGRDRTLPMPTMAAAAIAGSAFAPGLDAAALRALPAERVTGDLSMMTMMQPTYAGPIVDGRTMLGMPVDAAAAGLYARVPVMLGANSADGIPFDGTDKRTILAAFGPHEARACALYDPDGTASGLAVAVAVSADRMFIEPARAIARALAPRQPVFLYRFGYARPEAAAMGGAPHASEIPYVFDTLAQRGTAGGNLKDASIRPEEVRVAAAMHRAWIAFARTGRPDGEGLPPWPAATPDDTQVQLIDADGPRHANDPIRMRLDFAESLAQTGR